MSLQDLTQQYLDLRAQIAELDEKRKVLEGTKAGLEAQLLAAMEDTGVTSFNTDGALVYRQVRMFANVTDMEALLAYCKQHDSLHLLQRRVSIDALREWLEHDPNAVVEGIQVGAKSTISVRRK